jgi:hypothetical protein
MKRQLSKAARQEVVLAVRVRYQQATGPDQKRILDEFVAVTGYHRKHAIRVLAHSRGLQASALRRTILTPPPNSKGTASPHAAKGWRSIGAYSQSC